MRVMTELFVLQGAPSGFDPSLLMIGAMFIIIWLFFLRPQAKKQKQQAKFSEEIAKGDRVATSSGIVGRINKIEGPIVTIETGKTFITVTKGSISKEMTESLNKDSADE